MTDLERRLGTRDAVVIGLGSMIGAGIFSAMGPAARAAGSWLLLGLALAGFVAYCNATSSARLAAVHPASGGTYVYGTRQLGPFWGHLAGWSFVVGKTASCAAMAMTIGAYAWPGHEVLIGIVAVLGILAVNLLGVQKSAAVARVIVAVVLVVLATFVVVALTSPVPSGDAAGAAGAAIAGLPGPLGVLQAAGLLFFAFAGYARIATLGEEVRDPARTIPRAIPIALGITLVVYALVATSLLRVAGPEQIASSPAPLLEAANVGPAWLPGLVRMGAVVAATGSLLGLILGVSRTTLAMARDGHLPAPLARVSAAHATPWVAEVTVAVVVIALVLVTDLRGAIGFSSFGVLLYYAVANASARTLRPDQGRPSAWVTLIGLAGCVVLAVSLPPASIVGGLVVIGLGAGVYALRRGVRA